LSSSASFSRASSIRPQRVPSVIAETVGGVHNHYRRTQTDTEVQPKLARTYTTNTVSKAEMGWNCEADKDGTTRTAYIPNTV
jgi:hypothetical protein